MNSTPQTNIPDVTPSGMSPGMGAPARASSTVIRQAPLSERTTFGVGGPARQLVEVADVTALATTLAQADEEGSPVLILGGGSNVLISDDGFAGTVVRVAILGRQATTDGDDILVSVGAGEDWATFVTSCVAERLSGVECLSGIPGLVGGTPIQNVSAYGQEVRSTIQTVGVWDRQQQRAGRLTPSDCGFSYRDSIFKRSERHVVTDVVFRLRRSRCSQPVRYAELAQRLGLELEQSAPLEETAQAVLDLRRAKGMVLDRADPDTRSAGSFFTNPLLDDARMARLRELAPEVPTFPDPGGHKVPAAWLVEHAGFRRGYRRATAAISGKHALALTASAGGTAADVLALAQEVRAGVMGRFGVLLEPEPVLVGLHL
jgi:UDP-N-acetylmuramate dehydrogenase